MEADTRTITELLAEKKTLKKRIADKRQNLLQYIVRDDRLKDPLEAQGGSKTYITQELQAIDDLEERLVNIMLAIASTNAKIQVSLGKKTRSVAYVLIDRRENWGDRTKFLSAIQSQLNRAKQLIESPRYQQQAGETIKLVVSIDEKAFNEMTEQFTTMQGEVDGKLSLLNATTRPTVS